MFITVCSRLLTTFKIHRSKFWIIATELISNKKHQSAPNYDADDLTIGRHSLFPFQSPVPLRAVLIPFSPIGFLKESRRTDRLVWTEQHCSQAVECSAYAAAYLYTAYTGGTG